MADAFLIIIFQFIILIFSIVIHEVSHGLVAHSLGDPTAKYMGRLTLNPIKHIDPFGTIILPLLLFFGTGGRFVIGWAKPVPYDPRYLKNQRLGQALIALAGPFSNFIIALAFGLIWRNGFYLKLIPLIIIVNLFLAVFNLIPIPPLDGSKILFSILPARLYKIEEFLNQYSLVLIVIFIIFASNLLTPFVLSLFKILTGSIF